MVFESGVSGGWTKLDGYKIISARLNPQCYRQCSAAAFANNSIRTSGGLRLGLTRQEVIQLLGKPTHAAGNKLTFQWQSRQAMTKEEIEKESKTFSSPAKNPYWNVLDTIYMTLANDRVEEIEVLHTVSY